MKKCGDCSLCCKLERITELAKPRNETCHHLAVGGCSIYSERPESCRTFRCWWLDNEDLPDDLRPDRIGVYAAGDPADGYLRVMVDKPVNGAERLLENIRDAGLHAIINHGDSITFVRGNAPRPTRILLDWVL